MGAAGNYDRLVRIRKLVEDLRDESGAVITNQYEDRCKLWAERLALGRTGGQEIVIGHEMSATAEYWWRTHWRKDILHTDILIYEGEQYEILDVQDDRKNAETLLKTRLIKPR